MDTGDQKHKPYRAQKKGGKIVKKQRKDGDKSRYGNNPKAFTFQAAVKAQRKIKRAADLSEKKKHIPVVDRTPLEPPPIVVAVVGPPQVGKSTLVRALIKHYVRQKLTEIKGPVTLVTGKHRRLTIMEVPNDINAMIDAAKVADLVLLLINASFGFTMEHFEFINICELHGTPKIMAILTHMDQIKKATQLKQTKKALKQRLWKELYAGAKLFFLTGILHESYLHVEIKNLARFISVMKFRPMPWRDAHPYIVCDRVEDTTDPLSVSDNADIDRRICVYGWVRGSHLRAGAAVHVPGFGDTRLTTVSSLPDPCAFPTRETKRSLNAKERVIYAPFSGLGNIVYDKDAIYIETGGAQSFVTERSNNTLLTSLGQTAETFNDQMAASKLQLLPNTAEFDDASSEEDAYDDEDDEGFENGTLDDDEMAADDVVDEDGEGAEDEELEEDEDVEIDDENRAPRSTAKLSLDADDVDDDAFGGLLKRTNAKGDAFTDLPNQEDGYCFLAFAAPSTSRNWSKAANRALLVDCFVAGKYDSEDEEGEEEAMDADGEEANVDETMDVDGEGEHTATGDDAAATQDGDEDNARVRVHRQKAKEKLKARFDAEYDETNEYYNSLKEELDQQAKVSCAAALKANRSAFEGLDEAERQQVEGFRPGLYVRMELNAVPVEFGRHLDVRRPLIVGGLLPGEQNMGVVQVRVHKHRYYQRVLKSRDPLIISCGWRRYQTMVVYSMQDHNMRQRFRKYARI